jgi:hypothetical protein
MPVELFYCNFLGKYSKGSPCGGIYCNFYLALLMQRSFFVLFCRFGICMDRNYLHLKVMMRLYILYVLTIKRIFRFVVLIKYAIFNILGCHYDLYG